MSEQTSEVHRTITTLVRLMADHPEAVTVDLVDGTTLQVRVAESDFGKVIGMAGRNARALRTILAAIAKAQGTALLLDIEKRE